MLIHWSDIWRSRSRQNATGEGVHSTRLNNTRSKGRHFPLNCPECSTDLAALSWESTVWEDTSIPASWGSPPHTNTCAVIQFDDCPQEQNSIPDPEISLWMARSGTRMGRGDSIPHSYNNRSGNLKQSSSCNTESVTDWAKWLTSFSTISA